MLIVQIRWAIIDSVNIVNKVGYIRTKEASTIALVTSNHRLKFKLQRVHRAGRLNANDIYR